MPFSPQSLLVNLPSGIPGSCGAWESLEQRRPHLEEDQVRKHLDKLDMYESMEPNGMHSQVLQALSNITETTLKYLCKVMQLGNVPEDWKKADVTSIFKKGYKEDLGNSSPGKLGNRLCLNPREDDGTLKLFPNVSRTRR